MAELEQKIIPRVVYIGDIDAKTGKETIMSLMSFDMLSDEPIRVVINSYGGIVDEMFGIYDAIKTCNAPIMTIGVGKIMSASVLLLAAGCKGERVIAENARILIHEISAGVCGKLYELENEIAEYRETQDRWEKCLAKETGHAQSLIQGFMNTHSDVYLSPAEAIDFGMADKVVG